MKILWTHNFDPDVLNKGVFMHIAARELRARGVDLTLEYLGNLRSIRRLRSAVKHVEKISQSFDLVHAQFGSACALATSSATTPKVLTLRGSDWTTYGAKLNRSFIHSRLAAQMTRFSINSFDRVIAVSNRMKHSIIESKPRTKVEVMPSPIDLSRFVPMDKKSARAALGFVENSERWVLFNSLDLHNPVKRYELAKQAFELANEKLGNLRLRVATDIPHDQMPAFVASCDLLLCTSQHEGWPNSVKEALACNVPFVATDVSDLKDIAALSRSCSVCPPSAEKLADAMCAVLTRPQPENLRQHVESFDINRQNEVLLAIYKDVLSQHKVGSAR